MLVMLPDPKVGSSNRGHAEIDKMHPGQVILLVMTKDPNPL